MLLRPPTRIELKADDMEEYDEMLRERAAAASAAKQAAHASFSSLSTPIERERGGSSSNIRGRAKMSPHSKRKYAINEDRKSSSRSS